MGRVDPMRRASVLGAKSSVGRRGGGGDVEPGQHRDAETRRQPRHRGGGVSERPRPPGAFSSRWRNRPWRCPPYCRHKGRHGRTERRATRAGACVLGRRPARPVWEGDHGARTSRRASFAAPPSPRPSGSAPSRLFFHPPSPLRCPCPHNPGRALPGLRVFASWLSLRLGVSVRDWASAPPLPLALASRQPPRSRAGARTRARGSDGLRGQGCACSAVVRRGLSGKGIPERVRAAARPSQLRLLRGLLAQRLRASSSIPLPPFVALAPTTQDALSPASGSLHRGCLCVLASLCGTGPLRLPYRIVTKQ